VNNPKAFMSYSWSSPVHEAWVLNLAQELVSQGVDVILDKWHLREGHDAIAFMESMVTDPDIKNVILVCDKKYAEKSNSRAGGAGTEAQILTPELYSRKSQDKFVAVVAEVDEHGEPYVPAYYKGRIYINLADPSTYSEEFERLVRWAWDRPLNVRPALGSMPAFLSEDANGSKPITVVPLRRAIEAIKSGRENAPAVTSELLDSVASGLEAFRIGSAANDFDDRVIESIEALTPYRNELIQLFATVATYNATDDLMRAIHRFFEKLIPYLDRPEHVNSWQPWNFDNYKFFKHELFLYCLAFLIRGERFEAANYLLTTEYYVGDMPNARDNPMRSYLICQDFLQSFEHRNRRKELRRLSLRADMMKERTGGTGLDFRQMMAADFILYLRSLRQDFASIWWPETLLYASRYSTTFETFARAKSVAYFNRVKELLGVANKSELKELIEKLDADQRRIPRWDYSGINVRALSQFDNIATVP
jgi:hypothetical protein